MFTQQLDLHELLNEAPRRTEVDSGPRDLRSRKTKVRNTQHPSISNAFVSEGTRRSLALREFALGRPVAIIAEQFDI
jgi:hypothetical protein